jgi:hypothetical protein
MHRSGQMDSNPRQIARLDAGCGRGQPGICLAAHTTYRASPGRQLTLGPDTMPAAASDCFLPRLRGSFTASPALANITTKGRQEESAWAAADSAPKQRVLIPSPCMPHSMTGRPTRSQLGSQYGPWHAHVHRCPPTRVDPTDLHASTATYVDGHRMIELKPPRPQGRTGSNPNAEPGSRLWPTVARCHSGTCRPSLARVPASPHVAARCSLIHEINVRRP